MDKSRKAAASVPEAAAATVGYGVITVGCRTGGVVQLGTGGRGG